MLNLSSEIARRFEEKYIPEPNSGCWLWIGAWIRKYGSMRIDGKHVYATHVSLELSGRVRPDGQFGLHTCDTPPCVNPNHLFWGTHQDNMDDCLAKGRGYLLGLGSKARGALTEEIVRQIRLSPLNHNQAGFHFGITRQEIRNIRFHKTYAWVK